jgi:hypothetical protein
MTENAAPLCAHIDKILNEFQIESDADPRDSISGRLDELIRLGLLRGIHR